MLSCRTGNDAFAGTVAAGVNYEPINPAVVSEVVNILYIHGMGGGGDSRIPSILKERIGAALPESFPAEEVNVVVRTYDFEPETGHMQIMAWVEELRPALVIGESLGSLQALRIRGVPRLFVSPSLNAPIYLGFPESHGCWTGSTDRDQGIGSLFILLSGTCICILPTVRPL